MILQYRLRNGLNFNFYIEDVVRYALEQDRLNLPYRKQRSTLI